MLASLGIDIGTSAVKVAALGLDGTLLAEGSAPYPTHRPRPGWVEQTPDDWWQASVRAIRGLLAARPDIRIEAVGLSGQVSGIVLQDGSGSVLGDAPIWLDTRATAEADALRDAYGPMLESRAATRISSIATASKLAWLTRHDPARMGRVRHLLPVKDYLGWRLTGERFTEPNEAAATALYDLDARAWIAPLCQAVGVDPAALPRILAPTETAGRVTAAAAVQTGLPVGIPVVPGGGDVSALAVGCGVCAPGTLGITLGTAGHIVLAEPFSRRAPPGHGLWSMPHADPALMIWLGLIMSGGLSLVWLHRLLASGGSALTFEAMAALAADVPAGGRGAGFLPFLEGVATPYDSAAARGGFYGLGAADGAAELVRAVMEGVAFGIRQSIEAFAAGGATIERICIAEGGARVDLWCQIIADTIGQPVCRLDYLNTSSLGAAVMAQNPLGGVGIADWAALAGRSGRHFTPEPKAVRALDIAFQRFGAAARDEIARSVAPVVPTLASC